MMGASTNWKANNKDYAVDQRLSTTDTADVNHAAERGERQPILPKCSMEGICGMGAALFYSFTSLL